MDCSTSLSPVRAEESVKTARVKDSIAKNEGYAFYCYKPHAIWYMFDVKMLSEPKIRSCKLQDGTTIRIRQTGMRNQKVATKDALKNVQIAWSNSLKGRSPAIAEFFERFQPDSG